MTTSLITERFMPIACKVLVIENERVEFDTTIAEATTLGELVVLPVAKRLGIEPAQLSPTLKKRVGDSVQRGELIASFSSLWGVYKAEYLSPCSGMIEFVSKETGHVGVRAPSRTQQLKAYASGVVSEVIKGKGVRISTSGVRLQGAFGVGGEKHGKLRRISVNREEAIRFTHIPDSCQGQVLFGGSGITKGAIDKAIERGVVGIVCGGLDDEVLHQYLGYEIGIAITGEESVPLTLIATEGFGSIPICSHLYKLLCLNEGLHCALNGATQVRAGALRPEVLIPEGREGETLLVGELSIGGRVRVLRAPHLGLEGVIEELPTQPAELSSGASVRVAKVLLDNGVRELLARINLEPL